MDLYMMNCELLATCSALGYLEGDVYHKEPDCLESVKDLIRYLRHEDEMRDVRQQLGAAQILQNDLLPLVAQHPQDKPLFDAVVRLMVNLTQPVLLCFGKVPQDPGARHCFLQVVSYLQAYKEAFASEKVFGVLSEKLYDLLQLDWEQRQEEDNLLIERMLLLVRNVLHVPADPEEEKSVDDDASTHDRVLWAMHVSGMDDLLKFLASSPAEQQWGLHVLEIVALMFRDQDPEQLVATGQARPAKEQGADVRELELLRQKELAEKKSRAFQRGSRHSRFGGSYVVQGLKSIGDRDVVFHKGLHNLKDYSHDLGKEARRVPKRKQPAQEAAPRRRSALNVRLFLREFCGDFLESCYNRLMYLVKDQLLREKAQQHDETYYLWAVAFFMAFNRSRRFRPELVSETLGVRTFHFIEQNLTAYYEAMLLDKRGAASWARRMHLALKAYRELLLTLQEMDGSPDEAVRHSSKIIKNNIFYVMEYRELFLALFRKFDATRQPRSFLRDLVETTHLFLKMLQAFCRGRGNLVVQSKRVRRKQRPRAGRAAPPARLPAPQELEELWPGLAEQLAACAQGAEPLPEAMVPFDATLETPVEEQRAEAMVRIQDSLLGRRAPAALALLRCAREVWPEGDVFGSPGAAVEEEMEMLKQIFFAPVPRQAALEAEEPGEEEEEEEEVEEEELASVQVSEKEFSFLDYLKRFASASVVKAYVLLLRGYRQNSAHTNHCVAKMLHRIACDLKMEALLFQLSVFCLFNRLLSDPSAAAYQELVTFAKYILGKFFALAATNKKAYVELLFWKSTAGVREMTEGYGSLREEAGSGAQRAPKWTPQEEEELRELYLKYKEREGEDVVGSILAHLRAPRRTPKQVIKQLVRLGLAKSVRDFPRERKGPHLVLWTEEQELELQRLFEEFQGTDDILGNIMKHITAKRSRARIVEKLLSLGLVAERKELYKKRKRKPGLPGRSEDRSPQGPAGPENSAEEEEEESDEEEEEEEAAWEEEGASSWATEGCQEQSSAAWAVPERDVQGLAHRLRQGGLTGPLLWLQNCLNRAAEDREEDGTAQPLPLVPLSEENEDAMEDAGFQQLLRTVGVRAPANEQESFWRIPATLSAGQLRRLAASLAREPAEGEGGSPGEPGAGAEQGAQARRKRRAPALPEEEMPGPEQLPESLGSELERARPAQLQPGPKRSRVSRSQDDEAPASPAEAPAVPEPDSDEEGPRPPSRRKRLRIEEED